MNQMPRFHCMAWSRHLRWQEWAGIGLLVLLSACTPTRANDDLVSRQLALSAEQKLKFDRVFFNEIWLWNQHSWHYGDPPSGAKRQREFEAMAAQGYLPAHVALQMFDFANQTKHPDKAAFELLRRAADAGDVSSACALVPLWALNDIGGYPRDITWARVYIERGAKAGHFACLVSMAELYRKGIVQPPDSTAERRLLLEAAEQGYSFAWRVLDGTLLGANRFVLRNLDRSMCWHSAITLYAPFGGIDFDFYRLAASGAYPQLDLSEAHRAAIGKLADKWESRMKAAKVIMDIVNECLILEREALNDAE